ncbi:coiled-coil domain-containing protein [Thermoflexus hugenholtzii]|uniref:Uncharacterized protein n=1 Tax=Thermoflexus hugenholtzii JAD2 TaxID=877466 RepID=A0A212QWR2_9CHLR|nr:hypothetical protein [Thermoflexus hugenholtzii]SNB64163.1 hypothetical protein SAMN02746019_00007860 [Thermoflexus hugenholtzii JAD2]
MAFTVEDLRDLAELLRAHPEWREPLWALLAAEEVRRMPERMERGFRRAARLILALYRAQRRQARETDARLAEMAEAIHRLGETVRHLAETVHGLAEAQRRTEENLQRLSEAFVTHHQEFLAYQAQTEARLAELNATVGNLAEVVQDLSGTIHSLAEAQRRTEENLQRLTEAFAAHRQEFLEHGAETDRRFAEMAEAIRNLSEAFTAHRQEFLEHRAETERRFAELAEAQRRTEESLAAHRAETDRRFAELAQAQRRTEETLQHVLLRQEQFQRTLDRFGQIVGVTVEGQMVEAVQRYLAERGYVLLEPIATLAIDRIGELDGIARVRGPDGEEAWFIISVKARLGPRAVHDFADLLRNAAVQEALRAYGVRGPVLPLIFGVVLDRRALELAREARIGLLLQAQGELVAPQPWALEATGNSEDP